MEFVTVRRQYEYPSEEYPMGSYLETVENRVLMATGRFSGLGPSSPYWHGGPPFVMLNVSDWKYPWKEKEKSSEETL